MKTNKAAMVFLTWVCVELKAVVSKCEDGFIILLGQILCAYDVGTVPTKQDMKGVFIIFSELFETRLVFLTLLSR